MRRLSDTLARLKRLPRGLPPSVPDTRLRRFSSGLPNPGQLGGWIYVPQSAAPGAPLVVVLHGCTQNAAGYDQSSGWSRLADEHGFVLLYPEQQRSNNSNLCFNWFLADDVARGRGEARSIREMVAAVQAEFDTDPQRVFVTGLSAGGAMAAAMLATYPDVFAGGAVIAGVPFGIARSVPEAFDRMRGHGHPHPDTLSTLVRSASSHSGDWPTLSVWHGTADQTVDRSNAALLIEQWRRLHGAPQAPDKTELVRGYPRHVWCDSNERDVIEEYSITGLGHGTPLDTRGSRHGEQSAPFMLEAGISSTERTGRFWGIVPDRVDDSAVIALAAPAARAELRPQLKAVGLPSEMGIEQTIENALRSAGLMK